LICGAETVDCRQLDGQEQEATVTVQAGAVAERQGPTGLGWEWRRDRLFFSGMAIAAAIVVFAGFAPTYYLKAAFCGRELSRLLHVHGLIFTTWVVLFVAQTALIALRRTPLHRRLGVAGGVLAAAMLVVGAMAAIDSARRGFTPPGGPPPLTFLIIPLGDLLVFSVLVGAALYRRRQPQTHKRLMLLATLALLTPAVARLPGIAAAGPPAFWGLTDLFIVACLVYDRLTIGRIHPAFKWGGLFVLAMQPMRLIVGGTAPWLAFAQWLTR
jgi:hypothetical protein